jgi:hypothetical protein
MNWRFVLLPILFFVVIISIFSLSLYFANMGVSLHIVDVQASAQDGLSMVVVGTGNLSATSFYLVVETPLETHTIVNTEDNIYYMAINGYVINRSSVIETGQHLTVLEYYYDFPSIGTSLRVVAKDIETGVNICDVSITVSF